MEFLLTIVDQDFDSKAEIKEPTDFFERVAARGVVINDKNEIALMKFSEHGYYKLPGGGVDEGEEIEKALRRELIEEIGCEVEIMAEIGQILEYRGQTKLKQTSYCYLAKQIGEQKQPSFTQDEIDEGFEMIWVKNIDETIELFQQSKPSDYGLKFMNKRDLVFLAAAKRLLEKH